MKFTIQLEMQDYAAYLAVYSSRIQNSKKLKIFLCLLLVWTVAILAMYFWNLERFKDGNPLTDWSHLNVVLALPVVFYIGLYFWFVVRAKSLNTQVMDLDSLIFQKFEYELDDDGIGINSLESKGYYKWSRLRSINNTPTHLIVFLDNISGIILPRDQIDGTIERYITQKFEESQATRSGDS